MSFIVTPAQLTHRAEFYRQLAQLTQAGLDVVRSLQQIQRGAPMSYRAPLKQLQIHIGSGLNFTDSLRHIKNWLPEFDIALIEAGERSGRLDVCFRMLSDYYNERARMAKQLISQLIYPTVLVHVAVFVFLIVLPFAGSQFQTSLGWLFLRAAAILLPLYAGVLALIYAMQGRRSQAWRATMEALMRPIPILGSARQYLALARLSTSLEALISAGVNIIEAWDIAAAASGSAIFQRAVARWKPQVTAGQTPAEAVAESPAFPQMFASLYHTGEVSGQLDDSLRRLYRYYNDEGLLKLGNFVKLSGYAIYGVVAAIVAYKVITFWVGYFGQIANATNGF